jgi:hypothetical protein
MTIIQILLVITILFMGNFLERFEREVPNLFWAVIFLLAIEFTLFNQDSLIHNISPSSTEQIVFTTRGGSDSKSNSAQVPNRPGFIGKSDKTSQGTSSGTNPGNNKGYPAPHFPWGVDPKYDRSRSNDPLARNKLPATRDWISDPSAWENDERENPLKVPVDFPYQLNDMGDPTLFIPNLGSTQFQGIWKPIRVEFDQTASHIHHAPEFGIKLPDNFDMVYYKSLNRRGRIEYAKSKLPRSLIISYQNEIGKNLTTVFNSNTYSVGGAAGKRKVPTQLIIAEPRDIYPLPGQEIQTPPPSGKRDIMLGIVREDGLHISSYPITQKRLNIIENDDFWVLKNQDI